MRLIGIVLIGVVSALAGYPVYSPITGFSGANLVIVIGLSALWQLIWWKLEHRNY